MRDRCGTLEKLQAYAASHPDARALSQYTSHHAPTANYYETTYFSIRSPAYAVSFGKRLSGQ